MKIWKKIRQNLDKNQASPKNYTDIISELALIESKTKAHLKISLPNDVVNQAKSFLKEKCIPWDQGVQLLIIYGLSDETQEEFEQLRQERKSKIFKLGQQRSIIRFRSYEYFQENRILTMKLRNMLNENRSLKKGLKKEGYGSEVSRNEWDNWNEEKIDYYYTRYLFGKKH